MSLKDISHLGTQAEKHLRLMQKLVKRHIKLLLQTVQENSQTCFFWVIIFSKPEILHFISIHKPNFNLISILL